MALYGVLWRLCAVVYRYTTVYAVILPSMPLCIRYWRNSGVWRHMAVCVRSVTAPDFVTYRLLYTLAAGLMEWVPWGGTRLSGQKASLSEEYRYE